MPDDLGMYEQAVRDAIGPSAHPRDSDGYPRCPCHACWEERQAILKARGERPLPLWMPEPGPIEDPDPKFTEGLRRWRAALNRLIQWFLPRQGLPVSVPSDPLRDVLRWKS